MSYRLTIRQCIDRAAGRLRAVGVDSPRVDAELLLLHVLQSAGEPELKRSDLFFRHPDPISDDVRDEFHALVQRRCEREPVQHIIGHTGFSGTDLACGPGAFIPRPETELLVEWATRRLGEAVKATDGRAHLRVVDLCTGPATIVLGLAHTLTNRPLKDATGQPADIELVGVELSDEALQWAERNIRTFAQHREMTVTVEEDHPEGVVLRAQRDNLRITLVRGDVTNSDVIQPLITADLAIVLSNPPYVPLSTPVNEEVRYDPPMAVFGGEDGMDVMTPMLEALAQALAHHGHHGHALPSRPVLCALEHDDSTQDKVIAELTRLGAEDIVGKRDLADRPRYVIGRFTPHLTVSEPPSGTS